MKFSRQEKVTFRYRLLLNRGGHMDNFDCILSNEENLENQKIFKMAESTKPKTCSG